MGLSQSARKMLWARAGNQCSYPDCPRALAESDQAGDPRIVGEEAHIVADSPDGPRGGLHPPGGDIDSYLNRILLCPEHHQLIDSAVDEFPIPVLVRMRDEHEALTNQRERASAQSCRPVSLMSETIYSSLLRVQKIPSTIWSAPCSVPRKPDVYRALMYPRDSTTLSLILKERRLYTFCDLGMYQSSFAGTIDPTGTTAERSQDWLDGGEREAWFLELLRESWFRFVRRQDLKVDYDHGRFYFGPLETPQGLKDKTVRYRSASGRSASRKVAYRPITRITSLPKSFWTHLAASPGFHHVDAQSWFLSLRPETVYSSDGRRFLPPERTTRRSAKAQGRTYNNKVLSLLVFWSSYLSGGRKYIIVKFGTQSLLVETELLSGQVKWPGVAGDGPTADIVAPEMDLFTASDIEEMVDLDEEGEF